MDFTGIINIAAEKTMSYVPKVLLALITLFVGLRMIKFVLKMLDKSMTKAKIEASLHQFLSSVIGVVLKMLLFITVISMFGVQMTSFIAVLGAAGLAVGLALQGSLGNLAGGVLILFFKPFKVGDLIEAQGFLGTVKVIQIFSTILTTPDNKTVIIPNGNLSNDSLVNYTKEKTRRVDMVFGIGYDDDIKKAKDLLTKIVKEEKRGLKDPKPQIVVAALGESSVDFKVRVWSKTEDYWGIYFDMTEKVKLEFDKAKISIPYPQRDVHVYKH